MMLVQRRAFAMAIKKIQHLNRAYTHTPAVKQVFAHQKRRHREKQKQILQKSQRILVIWRSRGKAMLFLTKTIRTNKLKKLLPAIPFLLPIGLPNGAIHAAQVGSPFDVTVSTVVGTACSLSGQVSSLGLTSITNPAGKLDSSKDLAATTVATITCNAGATIQLAATNGYYKSSTQSSACTTESTTCVLYDAKLSLNGTFTPIVNASAKTQSVAVPSSASGDIKLQMDIVGSAGAVLPASTYSEIFTVTVSTP